MNIGQEQVIRQIAHYKYLTLNLLEQLTDYHYQTVWEYSKYLSDLGFINKSNYGIGNAKQGRLSSILHLTNKGAKFLLEHTELEEHEVKHPSRNSIILTNDYFHRLNSVQTHISYDQFIKTHGYESLALHTYYDKGTGSQRSIKQKFQSATRLDFSDGTHIEPDLIAWYQKPDKKRLLFCIEVYNGHDTKRVITQLYKLLKATQLGLAPIRYGHDKDNRVLVIFEHESNMQAVLKKLSATTLPDGVERYLFFNLIERVSTDFGYKWLDLNYKQHNLHDL
jgi:hypothetical protein